MNVITLAYCIATSVATVPIINHNITIIILKPAKILESTPATTPCEAKIRFSMFPKIINPINGIVHSINNFIIINEIKYI